MAIEPFASGYSQGMWGNTGNQQDPKSAFGDWNNWSNMPRANSPIGGLSNMVSALMGGYQNYLKRNPSGGAAPGQPTNILPDAAKPTPTDPVTPGMMSSVGTGGDMPPPSPYTPPPGGATPGGAPLYKPPPTMPATGGGGVPRGIQDFNKLPVVGGLFGPLFSALSGGGGLGGVSGGGAVPPTWPGTFNGGAGSMTPPSIFDSSTYGSVGGGAPNWMQGLFGKNFSG